MTSIIPPTNPKILAMMEEFIKREPIFHRREWGTSRSDLENMTDEQFWEIGASGQIYTQSE
jgi:hypothetical protein